MNKSDALKEIIRFGIQRDDAFAVLLESDKPELTVAVTGADLLDVLQRYLISELDLDDLEEWAMLLECREEIDSSAIEDYLYALSNPELMGGINSASISKMVALLQAEGF